MCADGKLERVPIGSGRVERVRGIEPIDRFAGLNG